MIKSSTLIEQTGIKVMSGIFHRIYSLLSDGPLLEPQIIVSIFSINNLKHRWDIIPPEDSNAVRRAIRYFLLFTTKYKKVKA
ncbi:MAG: hypothetical protein EHM25_08610 [Nitrosopumilales archaeon]|nr:MAG: hypothetical protein EHM25_08610 [Nitrosopumilales archaeon]